MHKGKLIVSGIIFALIALLHLYRLISPFPVIFGNYVVPEAVSIIGLIVFGLLAAWDLWGGCCGCCCCGACACKGHSHPKDRDNRPNGNYERDDRDRR